MPKKTHDVDQAGPFVQVHPEDLQMLTISAVRYAIGRATYIVGETADFVMRMWPHLGEARAIIYRDVAEALLRQDQHPERRILGHDCDERAWRDLHRWMGIRLGHLAEG